MALLKRLKLKNRHSNYLVERNKKRYPIKLLILFCIVLLSMLWIFYSNKELTNNEVEIVRENQFETYQAIQATPSKQPLISNNKLTNQTNFTQEKEPLKPDKAPVELDLLVPAQ